MYVNKHKKKTIKSNIIVANFNQLLFYLKTFIVIHFIFNLTRSLESVI